MTLQLWKKETRTRNLVNKQCGVLQPKRLLTSRGVHSLFTRATCQSTCVYSCNKRRHSSIRLKSFDKNKKLETLVHSKDWNLAIIFENTACKTPQQISFAELVFTVILAKTWGMMNVAQITKSKQAFQTVEWISNNSHSIEQSNSSDVEWKDIDSLWAFWTQYP